ncbi:Unknown protein, partial [Striga hermonthica]
DSRDQRRENRISSAGERKGSPRAEREGRPRGWRPTQYTPLSAPQAQILEVMEKEIHDNVVRWPKTRKDGPTRPKSNLYCRFHKDYGHNTDDCRHLKDEIERLIKVGHLKEFIYKDREKSNKRRERSRSPRKRARTPEKEELPQKRGTIHMIIGGSTDGDSNRARKAYARGRHGKVEIQQVDENGPVINFGPADAGEVERSQNDALMITTQISGYEVQRVFVDTGSSVNVIFYDCLKRMELDIQLTPLHTSLFGFNGSEVVPLGETMLAVVLGEGDLRKVKMVRFVVVDVESAYNVILGRPALNAFWAVVSTYHMKLKFPVGDQVGEARGDQKLSRTCYQIAVKTNQRAEVKEGKKPMMSEKRPRNGDLEPQGELMEIQIGETKEQTTKIGKDLKVELRNQLITLLTEFRDVFAFTPEELTRIDPAIMEHKRNVDPLRKLVKQRLRRH